MTPDDEVIARLMKLSAETKLLIGIVRENLQAEYYSIKVREILAQCVRVEEAL